MKTNLRLWVIGSIALMGALLAAGFLAGVQPLLNAAASASSSAMQIAAVNHATQIRLTGLAGRSSRLDLLQQQEASAAAAVPSSLDANSFVDRVNAVAATAGVKIQSVTPGTAEAYTPPPSAQVAQLAAAARQQANPSPSPSTSAAPVAATVPILAATDPSITSANFTVIPMTVSVKGSMEATLRFTQALQHDRRLFLVSGYSMSTDGQAKSTVLATLTGSIYTLKQ
ncbi:MAG TPA: hypothetical protein VGO26_08705 [Amnibacterium sp.]|nr:hypothetical protein [Amnibacterium sp.]